MRMRAAVAQQREPQRAQMAETDSELMFQGSAMMSCQLPTGKKTSCGTLQASRSDVRCCPTAKFGKQRVIEPA